MAAGCNNVPRPGGGVYWTGDALDGRDFKRGLDSNALMGHDILHEIFVRLKEVGWLAAEPAAKDLRALVEEAHERDLFGDARVGNLIEFGRVVHAEMNAILAAARRGTAVGGKSLYCTTFPCHGCARHIIGAGIAEVVYIEPYPRPNQGRASSGTRTSWRNEIYLIDSTQPSRRGPGSNGRSAK